MSMQKTNRLAINISMMITCLRLPTHWPPSQIETRYSNEDIGKIPFEIISHIKKTFDCCIDQDEVVLIRENEKLWNAIKKLKNKGIRARFVTTVNEGNISACKQLMKIGEVFHNDGVKCSFQIVDGTNYLCYITENEDRSNNKEQKHHQLFHSDTKSFVEIQQYLFDNLCNKAISAREKIKEIERGIRHDFTDTISEPAEIRKIVINQIMSAKDEILLLFSTSNSFHRAKYGGMLNLLRQISNDVPVKVLIQAGDNIERDAIQEDLRESIKQIRVQYITKPRCYCSHESGCMTKRILDVIGQNYQARNPRPNNMILLIDVVIDCYRLRL